MAGQYTQFVGADACIRPGEPFGEWLRWVHGRDESLPYGVKIKSDVNRYGCGPGVPGPYRGGK